MAADGCCDSVGHSVKIRPRHQPHGIFRMAMELKLNQPPPSGLTEREKLNYTRTWLNCFCVDGSHAIQFGKMPMLRLDDYLARSSAKWYCSSQMNTAFDVHLVAYVQILLLMAQWKSIVAQQSGNGSTEVRMTLIFRRVKLWDADLFP